MWSVLSGRRHREGAALTHYAALDVSLEETAICVVDGTGRIVREMRVPLAILSGDMDAIVDARDHPCRLHQQVAHSTLTLLPGLGHMIHYSARPQIGRAVDGLMGLASTGPSPPKSASPRA